MKENIDLLSAIVGGLAALLKAIKKRMNFQTIIISAIVGAVLGFGALGVLTFFLSQATPNLIIFVSFVVGWVAGELTEIFEEAVKDGYTLAKAYAKGKVKSKIEEHGKEN